MARVGNIPHNINMPAGTVIRRNATDTGFEAYVPIGGSGGTVDATIIDGSANAVAGNAVFDALAGKQNLIEITAKLNTDLVATYPEGDYQFTATQANGFPQPGRLRGHRSGTYGIQMLYSNVGFIYNRMAADGGTVWTTWTIVPLKVDNVISEDGVDPVSGSAIWSALDSKLEISNVTSTIIDGNTHPPSNNAVFDALSLKLSGTTIITTKNNTDAVGTYPDGIYMFEAYSANGFPENGLLIGQTDGGAGSQILYSLGSSNIYKRNWTGTNWTGWVNLLTQDHVVQEAVEDEPSAVSSGAMFSALQNKLPGYEIALAASNNHSVYPEGTYKGVATTGNGFPGNGLLLGNRYGGGNTQLLMSTSGTLFTRAWTGSAWSSWDALSVDSRTTQRFDSDEYQNQFLSGTYPFGSYVMPVTAVDGNYPNDGFIVGIRANDATSSHTQLLVTDAGVLKTRGWNEADGIWFSWTTVGGSGGGTIDTVPTDGSANAVSSNAVFDALATKQNLLTITAPNNTTAGNNAAYPTGDYAFNATTANGYPTAGRVIGNRLGNSSVQMLYGYDNGYVYHRMFNSTNSSWSEWSLVATRIQDEITEDGEYPVRSDVLFAFLSSKADSRLPVNTYGGNASVGAQTINLFSPSLNTTVTLPSAVGTAGDKVTVQRINENAFTMVMATVGGQTINGSPASEVQFTMKGMSLDFLSDGTNWIII